MYLELGFGLNIQRIPLFVDFSSKRRKMDYFWENLLKNAQQTSYASSKHWFSAAFCMLKFVFKIKRHKNTGDIKRIHKLFWLYRIECTNYSQNREKLWDCSVSWKTTVKFAFGIFTFSTKKNSVFLPFYSICDCQFCCVDLWLLCSICDCSTVTLCCRQFDMNVVLFFRWMSNNWTGKIASDK